MKAGDNVWYLNDKGEYLKLVIEKEYFDNTYDVRGKMGANFGYGNLSMDEDFTWYGCPRRLLMSRNEMVVHRGRKLANILKI